MPAISALDAIGPAIQRTKTFLFKPFRLSTFLKLCLVAVITEGYGFNFDFSVPNGHLPNRTHFVSSHPRLTPELIVAIVVGALVLFVLAFVLFYLLTRLRFAYFHCLVHNTRLIRPGWRLYRTQATRFFWLNVVVGICFLLLAAILALPFVAGFWHLFRHIPPGGHPDTGTLISLLLLVLPVVFLFILAALATDVVLRDFMLPHFALDNATAGQAWTSVWARLKHEKAQFLVYTLLRIILPIAAIIGAFFVLIIPTLIVIAIFVLIGFGIHSAFAGATGGTAILGILFEILLGLVAFCIAVFVGLSVGGPLDTAIREYALLFYGARYERLGGFLFPPPDAPLPPPETA